MSNKHRCAGKDGFQRMNYLYQISNLLLTENKSTNIASSLYSNLMVNISRKTVQRLEIDLKRTICKRCRCLLLAGITCKVRIKKKKVVWSCLKCGGLKVFETNKTSCVTWTQKNEALVDILDYNVNDNTRKQNEKIKK